MILTKIARVLLSLRYRITIQGNHHLDHDGPVLILPNHPGLIDPVILSVTLARDQLPSPLLTQSFYDKPLLKPLFRWLGGIRVPDFESGSRDTGGIQQMYQSIIAALSSGKHVLLYPSGQTYRQGYEVIIGKQTTYTIVRNLPSDTKILLVRTRGLWGSIFSKAYFGTPSPLGIMVLSAIWFVLANGIFWIPRRKVSILIQDHTQALLSQAQQLNLQEFNAVLQDWYNEPGKEEPLFVRHYRYYHDSKDRLVAPYIHGSIEYLQPTDRDYSTIDSGMFDQIVSLLSQIKQMDPAISVTRQTALVFDLHMDSLDLAEIKILILKHYPQSADTPLLLLKTVGDLGLMAMGHDLVYDMLPVCHRSKNSRSPHRYLIDGSTPSYPSILHYRRSTITKLSSDGRIFDLKSGLQSSRDIALKAHIVARILSQFKEKKIGIMMPAVSATQVLILGAYHAHKIPVMINRTVSPESMSHSIQVTQLSHIVTSRAFVSKLNLSRYQEQEHRLIYLEDLVEQLNSFDKIRGLLGSRMEYRGLLPIHQRSDDTAVILFTSGSESLPKAVPLSHAHILNNLQGVLGLFELYDSDVLLHSLPPFHSFGYTVNTILPIITGLKVVCTPDPTDASTMMRMINHTKATILTLTPTFLRSLLSIARPGDLKTLRVVVLGAESCPDSLMQQFAQQCPHAHIIEGYGITECAPVISLNPVGKTKPGTVGLPLRQGSLLIREIDKNKPASTGQQGMIYRSAPSVFAGYLDTDITSPFELIDGVKYYKTGDLGYVDHDGYLTITGRLKRFVKIAGEMISLPQLEQYCHEYLQSRDLTQGPIAPEQHGPLIALEGIEESGRAKICVFTIIPDLTIEEIMKYLRSRGVSRLVQIQSIHYLEQLPVLGSGKIDYKTLKNLIVRL